MSLRLDESALALADTEMISDSVGVLASDLDALGVVRVLSETLLANTVSLVVSVEISSGALLLNTDVVDGSGEDLESRLADAQSVFVSNGVSIGARVLLALALGLESLADTVTLLVSVEVGLRAGGGETSLLSSVAGSSLGALALSGGQVSNHVLVVALDGGADGGVSELLESRNTLALATVVSLGVGLLALIRLAELLTREHLESSLAETLSLFVLLSVGVSALQGLAKRRSGEVLESRLAIALAGAVVSDGVLVGASDLDTLGGARIDSEASRATADTLLVSDHVGVRADNGDTVGASGVDSVSLLALIAFSSLGMLDGVGVGAAVGLANTVLSGGGESGFADALSVGGSLGVGIRALDSLAAVGSNEFLVASIADASAVELISGGVGILALLRHTVDVVLEDAEAWLAVAPSSENLDLRNSGGPVGSVVGGVDTQVGLVLSHDHDSSGILFLGVFPGLDVVALRNLKGLDAVVVTLGINEGRIRIVARADGDGFSLEVLLGVHDGALGVGVSVGTLLPHGVLIGASGLSAVESGNEGVSLLANAVALLVSLGVGVSTRSQGAVGLTRELPVSLNTLAGSVSGSSGKLVIAVGLDAILAQGGEDSESVLAEAGAVLSSVGVLDFAGGSKASLVGSGSIGLEALLALANTLSISGGVLVLTSDGNAFLDDSEGLEAILADTLSVGVTLGIGVIASLSDTDLAGSEDLVSFIALADSGGGVSGGEGSLLAGGGETLSSEGTVSLLARTFSVGSLLGVGIWAVTLDAKVVGVGVDSESSLASAYSVGKSLSVGVGAGEVHASLLGSEGSESGDALAVSIGTADGMGISANNLSAELGSLGLRIFLEALLANADSSLISLSSGVLALLGDAGSVGSVLMESRNASAVSNGVSDGVGVIASDLQTVLLSSVEVPALPADALSVVVSSGVGVLAGLVDTEGAESGVSLESLVTDTLGDGSDLGGVGVLTLDLSALVGDVFVFLVSLLAFASSFGAGALGVLVRAGSLALGGSEVDLESSLANTLTGLLASVGVLVGASDGSAHSGSRIELVAILASALSELVSDGVCVVAGLGLAYLGSLVHREALQAFAFSSLVSLGVGAEAGDVDTLEGVVGVSLVVGVALADTVGISVLVLSGASDVGAVHSGVDLESSLADTDSLGISNGILVSALDLDAVLAGSVVLLVAGVADAVTTGVTGGEGISALDGETVLGLGVDLVSSIADTLAVGVSGGVLDGAGDLCAELVAESGVDLESSLANAVALGVSLSVGVIAVVGDTQVVGSLVSGVSRDTPADSLVVSLSVGLVTLDLLAELSGLVALEFGLANTLSVLVSDGVFVGAGAGDTDLRAFVSLESLDALADSVFVLDGVGVVALDGLALGGVLEDLVSVDTDAFTVVVSGGLGVLASDLLAELRVGVELVVGHAAAVSGGEISDGVGVSALDFSTEFELLVHVESVLALALSSLEVSDGVGVLAGEVSAGALIVHQVSESGLADALSVEELSIVLADLANGVNTVDAVLGALTVGVNSDESDTPGLGAGVVEVVEDSDLHEVSVVGEGLLELPDSVLGGETAELLALEGVEVEEASKDDSVDFNKDSVVVESGLSGTE